MQVNQRGRQSTVFIFIFLVLGSITRNPLFYYAGVILFIIVFIDLVIFIISIDTMEVSIIRRTSKNRIFQDNFLDVLVELDIKVKNLENIYFKDIYPDALTFVSGYVTQKIDPGFHTIKYRLKANRRGTHSFLESRIHLGSYFRMFEHDLILKNTSQVSIYPPVISKRSILAQHISSQFNTGRSKQRGMGIEPANVREYVEGDEIRHIDWKTSLRLNKMFTKEFESENEVRVFVMVDHSKPSDMVENLDNAVNIANHLVMQAQVNDQPVGLVTYTNEGVTNQAFMKKGKKHREISRELFSLEPKESKSNNISMDIGEIRSLERKLQSSKNEFFSVLAPFFGENSQHIKAMERQGIYQAIKRVIHFSKTPSLITIITERYDASLMESIRLATYYGHKVILIATSIVLPGRYDVFDLEEHYMEYLGFQKKIEKFKLLKGVKVIEAFPGDKPEQIVNHAVNRWKTHY
ncbi:MAG: DUF58 domain-containing protein [Candidatus Methanoperedens sp.]|nr:DUF58 domain-containing protein [Candidatus Methanoperedens sp.]